MSKATEAQIKEATRFVNKWKKILFLDRWTIDIIFSASPSKDDNTVGFSTHAEIEVQSRYARAYLTIYPAWFSGKNKEENIVHELYHCILDPLHVLIKRAMEGGKLIPFDQLHDALEHAVQWATNIAFITETEHLEQIEKLKNSLRKKKRKKK